MTREEQLELIRAKCIEANPEKFVGLLGRSTPVRLADVLLAIGEFRKPEEHYQISTSGTFTERIIKEVTARPFNHRFVSTGTGWNLRKDDLTEQSDECINFLADLLI